jgi:hypothetical protein
MDRFSKCSVAQCEPLLGDLIRDPCLASGRAQASGQLRGGLGVWFLICQGFDRLILSADDEA